MSPQPPEAFTSGLPVPRVTPQTAGYNYGVNWELRRQDFHLQVQQLVSLRVG